MLIFFLKINVSGDQGPNITYTSKFGIITIKVNSEKSRCQKESVILLFETQIFAMTSLKK
jgi:hypothetical protein